VITRRAVSLVGGFGLMLASPPGFGQAGGTIRRVGVVTTSSEAQIAPFLAALKQGMSELGWQESRDIEYRFVSANGISERYDALIAELIAQKVEVIVVANNTSARAAQRATRSLPIVMVAASAVVENGIVASLSRPGGNVTGLSTQFEDVLPKLVETMHAIAPGARRLAFLLNEASAASGRFWAVAQTVCARLGLDPIRVVADGAAEFARAAAEIRRQAAQAVVVSTDPVYVAERVRLQEAMFSTRLPVGHGFREHVVLGGLCSYGVSLSAIFHQAARYVDKILKGAKPADLPIEQPTKFEMVINLKTAKTLGLTIPQTVLLRADEVIQ
jgi:putative ABC transport system substrate-binding protein